MFVEHKEAMEVTEAPAKTLKLSEAIRLGARLRPQGFGRMCTQTGKTCALGAAYEATFGEMPTPGTVSNGIYELSERFGLHGSRIMNFILDKNDRAKWTRERIADAVEALGH